MLLILAVVALYVLHQDVWFWRTPEPLLFGFLPIGLWYHAGFTIAVTALMWTLVKFAWPADLERKAQAPAAHEREGQAR